MVVQVPNDRTLDGRREAFAHHAQGADLRPHWRTRGGPNDVLAGTARRGAQLGLPLLLAARRDLDFARVHEHGVLRGSASVAGLAPPRRRRQSRSDADHVWARRRAASPGIRAAVAARLRELRAGA